MNLKGEKLEYGLNSDFIVGGKIVVDVKSTWNETKVYPICNSAPTTESLKTWYEINQGSGKYGWVWLCQ